MGRYGYFLELRITAKKLEYLNQSAYYASGKRRSTTQTYSQHVAVNFFYHNLRQFVFELSQPEHKARVPAQWSIQPAHV